MDYAQATLSGRPQLILSLKIRSEMSSNTITFSSKLDTLMLSVRAERLSLRLHFELLGVYQSSWKFVYQ